MKKSRNRNANTLHAPISRESYLLAVINHIRPLFSALSTPAHPTTLPTNLRVSIGFPSTGALSAKSRVLGECWPSTATRDGHHTVFVSPVMGDVLEVMGVLVHELVHAAVGVKCKHRGEFKRVALALGLEGKMTSTVVGEELREKLEGIVREVDEELGGGFPHSALDPGQRLTKKQSTRLLKIECREGSGGCGFVARTTRKWVEAVGLPTCACGVEWELSEGEVEEEEGEEE